jgi:cell wall-associated NlpC family hydrolase
MKEKVMGLLAAAVVLSCASAPKAPPPPAPPQEPRASAPAEAPATGGTVPAEAAVRAAVVSSAQSLLGQKTEAKVTVRDRPFVLDCIGTVSAAWWGAGYDLQRDFPRHEGNGVTRLYRSMTDWGALKELREPKPGDVVFWEDTYDRNGNGKLYDDGITHAGIVVSVEADGTVTYLHASVSRGVVTAYFNLLHPSVERSPEGKVWNSPMMLSSDRKLGAPRWLSGDLWTAFGDAGRTAATLAP